MSVGDSGTSQEAQYANSGTGIGEPYFEERQMMRDQPLVRIFLLIGGIVFPGFALHMLLNSEISPLFALWFLVGFAWLAAVFLRMGVKTVVRSDGVFQQVSPRYLSWIPLLGYGDIELAPLDIHACHVVTESGIDALDPSSLPDRTRWAIESGNATGVYLETSGEQPEFSGIVSASGMLAVSVRLYSLPGLLVSDRPNELVDAIGRARGRR